jgi:hypothetical protein
MQARVLLLCALVPGCQARTPVEPDRIGQVPATPDPIAAFAGRWIHRGPYDIIGGGVDTTWTIESGAGEHGASGWTLRKTLVFHPTVNENPRVVTRMDFEPVELSWVDGAFGFPDPANHDLAERITVELRGGKLLLPAIVQRDERTWEYRSWMDGGVMQCAFDPLRVPSGPATHPFAVWGGQPSTYRTTQVDSIYARGERVTAIEFAQTSPKGEDWPCAELVLERDPNPPYIRRPNISLQFASEEFERLQDDDWRAILELPPHVDREDR